MNYTVGQQLAGGQIVVASVDAQNLILSVTFPFEHDAGGNEFGVTYSAGVTEQAVTAALTGLKTVAGG